MQHVAWFKVPDRPMRCCAKQKHSLYVAVITATKLGEERALNLTCLLCLIIAARVWDIQLVTQVLIMLEQNILVTVLRLCYRSHITMLHRNGSSFNITHAFKSSDDSSCKKSSLWQKFYCRLCTTAVLTQNHLHNFNEQWYQNKKSDFQSFLNPKMPQVKE